MLRNLAIIFAVVSAYLLGAPPPLASENRGVVIVPYNAQADAEFDSGTTVIPIPQPKTLDDPPGPNVLEKQAIEGGASSSPQIQSPKITGTKVALILGNSDYATIGSLANPGEDARAMSKLFGAMGFETWTGINLGQSDTMELVAKFAKETVNAEFVVFFYAGHAVQVDGRNYVLPTDLGALHSQSDIIDQSIPLDSILGLLASSSGSRLIFLDACRDNPFATSSTRQISTSGGRSVGSSGLARIEARAGTMINYATAPGAVAYDGANKNSPFTEALVEHLDTPGLPLEVAMVRVRASVAEATGYQQIPWSHSSLLQEIILVPGEYVIGKSDAPQGPDLSEFFQAELAGEVSLKINGADVRTMGDDSSLGESLLDFVRQGANHIETRGRRFRIWVEGETAHLFPDAYTASHAILVAIDDYPDASGFRDLGFMEQNADKLADQLELMGFPENNIVKLYGADATKSAILGALSRFWGRASDGQASRVVVYFGGHGTHISRVSNGDTESSLTDGLLIPYDYDPDIPYHTALLLEDLRNQNIKRTSMHHTLMLIDACSSGLVLPKFLSADESNDAAFREPGRWQTIQANLSQPHSGIIVAGTGEERALWVNGGIFTRSLIEALEGGADINHDGLIEFGELHFELFRRVRGRTLAEGLQQTPSTFSAGPGRIFFERPVQ